MTDLSEAPTRVGVRRTVARWYRDLQSIHSPILRYGLAVVCVGIAIGLALTLHRHEIHEAELPILVLSIALIAWYAGAGPTVLAVVLAALCLNYTLFTRRSGSIASFCSFGAQQPTGRAAWVGCSESLLRFLVELARVRALRRHLEFQRRRRGCGVRRRGGGARRLPFFH